MFTSNRATCLICRLNICQSILKSFKTLPTLTVQMLRHTSLPNALNCHIQDICLWASVTPATLWGIGHTGNRSDQEHGSVRTRHHSDVSRSSQRDSNTHRNTIPLQHADPGEHSPASMIGPVPLGAVLPLTTLSLRDIVVVQPPVREGRRRSLIRRGNTLPLLVLLLAALPLLPPAKEKENGTSLKRRRRNTLNHFHPSVIRVRRSTRGRGVLLHLLLLRLLQFLQTLLLLLGEVQPGRSLE